VGARMIRSKADLLNYIKATAEYNAVSDEEPNKKKERQRIFLTSIIKRYKFYFLSGYTMKFI
jgi:hypothetical protein